MIDFPLTAKYDPRWIADNALGENALCQTELLAGQLPFRAGMRVLDLGCGRATSSIFLAREFGVEVWAADKTVSPSENRQRTIALQCDRSVFPLRVDARRLPFAKEFFDVVIGIDSFLYFATDERYLWHPLTTVSWSVGTRSLQCGVERFDGVAAITITAPLRPARCPLLGARERDPPPPQEDAACG